MTDPTLTQHPRQWQLQKGATLSKKEEEEKQQITPQANNEQGNHLPKCPLLTKQWNSSPNTLFSIEYGVNRFEKNVGKTQRNKRHTKHKSKTGNHQQPTPQDPLLTSFVLLGCVKRRTHILHKWGPCWKWHTFKGIFKGDGAQNRLPCCKSLSGFLMGFTLGMCFSTTTWLTKEGFFALLATWFHFVFL